MRRQPFPVDRQQYSFWVHFHSNSYMTFDHGNGLRLHNLYIGKFKQAFDIARRYVLQSYLADVNCHWRAHEWLHLNYTKPNGSILGLISNDSKEYQWDLNTYRDEIMLTPGRVNAKLCHKVIHTWHNPVSDVRQTSWTAPIRSRHCKYKE